MVLLVLDLEVTVFRSRVIHVDHILAVDQLSELLVAGSASPCSVMDGASGDYLVGICRVGSGYIWQRACDLVSVRVCFINHTRVAAHIDGISRVTQQGGCESLGSDSIGAAALERARKT